jgi:hypothetical protein
MSNKERAREFHAFAQSNDAVVQMIGKSKRYCNL